MAETLQKGEWSFVTYPAALFARSLLASLADLPPSAQGINALRQLQASQSPLSIAHLTQTLHRELREETGLLEPADYRSAPSGPCPPTGKSKAPETTTL